MRSVLVFASLCLFAACSAPVDDRRDGGRARPDGFYGEDDLDSGTGGGGGAGGTGGGGGGAQDAGPPCVGASAARTSAIQLCLDQGRSPNQCTLEQGSQNFCDTDGDGVFDDLEVALGKAYAAAFAFNGGVWGGNSETCWPGNTTHFASHSRLIYRPNGQPETIISANPVRDQLWQATYTTSSGNTLRAYDSSAGGDFWLCLNDTSTSTRVQSRADMLALPDGVEVLSVVHPANGNLSASAHLFVATGLFFPYNEFSGLDNHEGDWETVAVFVNRATGVVEYGYFERHNTTDNQRFINRAIDGTRNPSSDAVAPAVSASDAGVHGLRFWDDSGNKHHVIAYVGTGAHAMYDYPGNTYIIANGPRDTHAGDKDKYATWLGQLYPGFNSGSPVVLKTTFFNPGEPNAITLNWARYRGQWGCDNDAIAKSYPGPFGNGRLARPMFERVWGNPPTAPAP
jgi:hypothetical protein